MTLSKRSEGDGLSPRKSAQEQLRKDRAARYKKRRRKEQREKVLVGLLGLGAILGVAALVVGLGGVLFYIAWNLGVVNVVAACGGSVSTINFWTAVGASLAVGIIRRVFSRKPVVEATAKS